MSKPKIVWMGEAKPKQTCRVVLPHYPDAIVEKRCWDSMGEPYWQETKEADLVYGVIRQMALLLPPCCPTCGKADAQ